MANDCISGVFYEHDRRDELRRDAQDHDVLGVVGDPDLIYDRYLWQDNLCQLKIRRDLPDDEDGLDLIQANEEKSSIIRECEAADLRRRRRERLIDWSHEFLRDEREGVTVFVFPEKDHERTGGVENPLLTIDLDVIASIVSAAPDYIFKLQRAGWLFILNPIDVLLDVGKIQPLTPNLTAQLHELAHGRNLVERIRRLAEEVVEVELPLDLVELDAVL